MTNSALDGKPYAGNPHVRIDEGDGASAKPRRSSLLYKKQLVVSLAFVVGGVWAGTVAVDGFQNVGMTVSDGRMALTDTVRFGDHGAFIKAGAGELVLPLEKVDKAKDYAIHVTDGTLTLQPGTNNDAAVDPPAVVRNRAAFWVDAADETGSVVTDGGDVVTRWCDRRETSFASPIRWNARPKSTGAGKKRIDQKRVVKDGRTSIYFGGYDRDNDNYLKFLEGNTEKKLNNVRHMFAVHGVYECWGSPIGATGNPCDWFVSSSIERFTSNTRAHFIQYANTMAGIFTGRTFLDGERIDPFTQPPKAGFQLLETEFTDVPTIVDAFYNMKDAVGRQGGDYLAEAIVFTNVLTSAERLEIEDYLMKKWDLGGARTQSGHGRMVMAAGTRTSVDVISGETVDWGHLSFAGEGVFEKTGSGTLVVGKGSFVDYRGEFGLADGSVSVRASKLPAMKVAAGEKIVSSASYPGRYAKPDSTNPVWIAQCGYTVSKTVASSSSVFEKEGDDALTVQNVPASVKYIDVKGGTLVFAAPAMASALVPGAPLKAMIPNPDFELPCVANATYNRCTFTAGTMLNGWTRSSKYSMVGYLVENYSSGDVGPAPAHARDTMCYAPIPQGVQALVICNNGEAYTDAAVFPKSGRYTLSLLESSRYNRVQTGSYQVKIGSTWDTATVRAERLVNAQRFRRVRIDLGYVEAGTYCLGFSVFAGNARKSVDGALIFDDLSIDFVSESAEERLVQIPNGDFEICTNRMLAVDRGDVNPVMAYSRTNDNEAVGWTFDNSSVLDPGVALGSSVTPYNGDSGALTYDNYRLSDIVDGLLGSVHLSMFGTSGSAKTTFRLEKGRYCLRGKLLHRGGKFNNAFNNAASIRSAVAAKVVVGGQETDLGSVDVTSSIMRTFDWPTPFEVAAETAEVALTLNQTEAKGMCLLDDLVLVKEEARVPYGTELIRNGSFESQLAEWTTFSSRVRGQNIQCVDPWQTKASDDVPHQFGALPYDGSYYIFVNDDAGLYQTLRLDPGLYRLAFAAHTRNTTGYDRQPIRAWLGDANGQSVVEIGRTPFITALFDQEFRWEFRVKTAGTYRLYLQGTDDFDSSSNRHTSVLDGVSLMRIRETTAKPSITTETQLRLALGTRLRLDYDGTNRVESVYYGGTRYRGVLSAETHSFIDGRGLIETAPPKSTLIIFR